MSAHSTVRIEKICWETNSKLKQERNQVSGIIKLQKRVKVGLQVQETRRNSNVKADPIMSHENWYDLDIKRAISDYGGKTEINCDSRPTVLRKFSSIPPLPSSLDPKLSQNWRALLPQPLQQKRGVGGCLSMSAPLGKDTHSGQKHTHDPPMIQIPGFTAQNRTHDMQGPWDRFATERRKWIFIAGINKMSD